MSSTGKPGHGWPVWAAAALRNAMSKPALCATSTEPEANSRNAGRTAATRGASATMWLLIPVRTVMNGGIGVLGRTRVWNSPSTWPARTFTAPISVI